MAFERKQIDRAVAVLLAQAALLFFGYHLFNANIELAGGRPLLFMDERVVYDDAMKILHPDSPEAETSLWWNIYDGGHHLYGRIFFVSSALAAWIPERLFGAQGAIVAIRMYHALVLAAAAALFSVTFLRAWTARACAFWIIMTLPYAAYHSTMPKPDPLQLVLIALFLRRYLAAGYGFGRHWIFLGLAYGAKITLLPGVCLLLAISFYEKARGALAGLGWFLLGWIIAEPLIAAGLWGKYWRATYHFVFFRAGSDAAVTWQNWVAESMPDYATRPIFGFLLAASIAAAAVISGPALRKRRLNPPVLLLLLGLSFLLPAVVGTQRVWGRYLFSGMVLTATAALALAEQLSAAPERRFRVLGAAISGLFLYNAATFRIPQTAEEYTALARRSLSKHHLHLQSIHDRSVTVLKEIAAKTGRRLKVTMLSDLYLLDPTPEYDAKTFWGYFLGWEDAPDVIIAWTAAFGLPPDDPPPETSNVYGFYRSAQETYVPHVSPPGTPCASTPCYHRYAELQGRKTVLYLLRSDLWK